MVSRYVLAGIVFMTMSSAFAGTAEGQDAKNADDLPYAMRQERCGLIGEIFYRLAEQRKAGVDEAGAARRVAEWGEGLHHTGSHIGIDYKASAKEAAHLVYRLSTLNSPSLGAFGKASCLLQLDFAHEEDKMQAGMVLLSRATAVCQKQNPGEYHNDALTDCIRVAEVRLADQLQKSKVQIH